MPPADMADMYLGRRQERIDAATAAELAQGREILHNRVPGLLSKIKPLCCILYLLAEQQGRSWSYNLNVALAILM